MTGRPTHTTVRLSPGTVVEESPGRRFIVIAAGRDQCYSVFVQYDDADVDTVEVS